MLYPLKFTPIYKEMIWGGRKLESLYKRQIPQDKPIGESWELTNRLEGVSIVQNGFLKGKTIQQITEEYPKEILGREYNRYQENFPLLIKILDANENLSIQVHPDGSLGKTEAWYVLEAEEGAKLIYGLKENISRETFLSALKNQSFEDVIKEVEVNPKDVFFIPAGTVHALCKGIMLVEVQQNSNTTYRLYDWGRVGADGKPRELHIDQALKCIDFNTTKEKNSVHKSEESRKLIKSPYFTIEKLTIENEYQGTLNGERFEILISTEGSFQLRYQNDQSISHNLLETILLPAAMGDYTIVGKGEILKVYIED